MSCGIDIGCYLAGMFAPVAAFWATWDLLIVFVAGLLIGGMMGWRMVLAIITLGIGYFIYERVKNVPEPDYETGEPPTPIKPKRKTIF